eukprot:scaffold101072_cov66-Phaeocystis_antarctica.AAC.1
MVAVAAAMAAATTSRAPPLAPSRPPRQRVRGRRVRSASSGEGPPRRTVRRHGATWAMTRQPKCRPAHPARCAAQAESRPAGSWSVPSQGGAPSRGGALRADRGAKRLAYRAGERAPARRRCAQRRCA